MCVWSGQVCMCAISHMAQGPVCTLLSALGGELVATAIGNPKQIAKRVDVTIQKQAHLPQCHLST